MNPDLIGTREEALTLVDADLITIQDYVMLCRFKGWGLEGGMPVPAPTQEAMPTVQDAHPRREGVGALLRFVPRPAPSPEAPRREPLTPADGRIVRFSLRNA